MAGTGRDATDDSGEKTTGIDPSPEIDLAATCAATSPAPPARWRETMGPRGNPRFQDTRWSLVIEAGASEPGRAAEALGELCRLYWFPLYAFARRSGCSREDAQDLTQGFFAHLLGGEGLSRADRERGRLRTFLLTALKRYMQQEWRRRQAQKRGGGALHLAIDFEQGEERYGVEPVDTVTPEQLYDRHWAVTLLARVTDALRGSFEKRGQGDRFEALKETLFWNANEASYAEIGESLGLSANAVKQAVFRLRSEFRRLLHDEIRRTLDVDDEEAIRREIAELMAVFRS